MRSLLLPSSTAESPVHFERRSLGDTPGFNEKWLQETLFAHPDLLPLEDFDPSAIPFIPVCRELPLPNDGRTTFLDILGVTPAGRLVLVECKLWRNPQARREVVGQILEYAALLRKWTYSDLEAQLKRLLGWEGENPLYRHVRSRRPETAETAFVDGVSRSLATGDFTLVIAGDGIRTDVQSMTRLLEAR